MDSVVMKTVRKKAPLQRAAGPAARQPARTGQVIKPVARWRVNAGRRLLFIEHPEFTVGVWPEFGGAITHYVHRPTGIDAIWRNPYAWPPRLHVLDQPMAGGSDLYDVMDGCWYVSLPSGSQPTSYFGAPMGLHGEMRAVPWTVENISSRAGELSVTLTGVSRRTPFVCRRELICRRDSSRLWWRETLTNRSPEALPVAWLHHPTFGGPLIEGARLVTSARTVRSSPNRSSQAQLRPDYTGPWPDVPERTGGRKRDCSLVPPPDSGVDHSVQLTDFDGSWGCIWNEQLRLGFGLAWDPEVFPWAWSWANSGGLRHYPLWGEGHIITLQPSTSPMGEFSALAKAGEVLTVPARGAVATWLGTGFVSEAEAPKIWTPTR